MRFFVALFMCFATAIAVVAGDASYKVSYEGGSITDLKSGEKMKLFLDQNQIRLVRNHSEVLVLPAAAIAKLAIDSMFTGESEQQLDSQWSLSAWER